MRHVILFLISCFLLGGCAAMEEAYYVDREFGIATMDAFDRQIVHQDYAHASKTVEGLPALHAEPIMETYHESFTEGFTQESISIEEVGPETSGSN